MCVFVTGFNERSGHSFCGQLQLSKLPQHDAEVTISQNVVNLNFCSYRKVDEINAEDEIREAFTVFDCVRLNIAI